MEMFKSKFDNLLINTLSINQEDIKPEAHFTNDLGVDSLDFVELTVEFEKVFKVSITDKDAEHLLTIGDAEKYLRNKVNMTKI